MWGKKRFIATVIALTLGGVLALADLQPAQAQGPVRRSAYAAVRVGAGPIDARWGYGGGYRPYGYGYGGYGGYGPRYYGYYAPYYRPYVRPWYPPRYYGYYPGSVYLSYSYPVYGGYYW
jgi:hypothetical protein